VAHAIADDEDRGREAHEGEGADRALEDPVLEAVTGVGGSPASSTANRRPSRRGATMPRPRQLGRLPEPGTERPAAKTHVAAVLAKLDLRDRLQAVIAAYESGLVVPEFRKSSRA
jgi:hypothetical protein